jgi:hypothetical protein
MNESLLLFQIRQADAFQVVVNPGVHRVSGGHGVWNMLGCIVRAYYY